ncbi:N-acetylmannosamine-6-phosphate 2-epimerase [Anaerosalibacter massiliensis]|uniref:Putative N-acetylmannosamine-6-phosphate 2-epimerase n=1 Tax=Anaerosalibacter massiliensis TaxID=1347392 RepID=A0A9X2MJ14_9FIRM|nr:N-acetylmannosamine-6-phosphate 2-epimerase [Anaerosalibacter massiliensis]MCR2044411.1 N-acetylmannosamine-6-phosphate 2-epimerase [Anaerosalibacter massiliensis]
MKLLIYEKQIEGDDMLDKVKGKLIVSCQALKDEPLHSSYIMGKMAKAAWQGGAAAIRANSVEDIKEIKAEVPLPIIGLIKASYSDSDVYITPTKREVDKLLKVGVDMIALDATNRKRPKDQELKVLISYIKNNNCLVMGDVSTFEEGVMAEKLGVDCVSTALAGYTTYSSKKEGPDFSLLTKLVKNLNIPVLAEGRINTPVEAKKALDIGAYAVVVGTAITRPKEITKKFVYSMI